MDDRELEQTEECTICGESVDPQDPMTCSSATTVVCYRCAVRLGAVYDTESETWKKQPDLPPSRAPEEP